MYDRMLGDHLETIMEDGKPQPKLALTKNKNLAILATFTTSAVWHGLYPGYYMFFLSTAFFSIVARTVRARIRPFFLPEHGASMASKRFYDFISWAATFFVLDYSTIAFRVNLFSLKM